MARIVPNGSIGKRQPGKCKGMLEIMGDSDDVILEVFEDYLP